MNTFESGFKEELQTIDAPPQRSVFATKIIKTGEKDLAKMNKLYFRSMQTSENDTKRQAIKLR